MGIFWSKSIDKSFLSNQPWSQTLVAVSGRNYNTEIKHDLLDLQHISWDTGVISALMDCGVSWLSV